MLRNDSCVVAFGVFAMMLAGPAGADERADPVDTPRSDVRAARSGVDRSGGSKGGANAPQGRTKTQRSDSDHRGVSSARHADTESGGTINLIVDVEMEGLQGGGGPITRCVAFEITDCADPGGSITVSQNVDFGPPHNLPGHGVAVLTIPAGDWDCVTAVDPKHSLGATCFIDQSGGDLHASFEGSPTTNPLCHALVQGELFGAGVIDILDFTIWAGLNLSLVDVDSSCGQAGFHADFDGDGAVTAADFSFIHVGFFSHSEVGCDVACGGAAESEADGRR